MSNGVNFHLQGGNRRTQGRRGGSATRGSKPRTGSGPVKFEGEFDFESSNAKFNKEEIEEELQQKLHENLRITDEVSKYLGFNPGLLTGFGEKLKLCVVLEVNCAEQEVNCVGLYSFVTNKIFCLPLSVKSNSEFFISYLFLYQIPPVMVDFTT